MRTLCVSSLLTWECLSGCIYYVCYITFVQRVESQCRRFTNVHYYYHNSNQNKTWCNKYGIWVWSFSHWAELSGRTDKALIPTSRSQTIPNHTKPNQTIPNQTILNHTKPNHTKPYQTIPNQTILNRTKPNHTKPYQTIPNQTILNYTKPYQTNDQK